MNRKFANENRQGAQRRVGANSDASDNNTSDTEKICLQLFLDIQIHHLVSRWGTDPDFLGSYSCDLVRKQGDLCERLCAPVDNLYFAGEAVSVDYSGSIHGGYMELTLQVSRLLKTDGGFVIWPKYRLQNL